MKSSTLDQTPLSQCVWAPLRQQARQRPARLRPRTLPAPLRGLAALTWVGAAIVLAFAPPAGLGFLIAWLSLATLVPVAVRARCRGTVGQAVARVGLLFLVPVYVGVMAEAMGFVWVVAFWAKAPQVAVCLTSSAVSQRYSGFREGSRASTGDGEPVGADTPVDRQRHVLAADCHSHAADSADRRHGPPVRPVVGDARAQRRRGVHSGVVLTVSAQLLLVAAAAGVVTCCRTCPPTIRRWRCCSSACR